MVIHFFRMIIHETYEKRIILPTKADMSRDNFPNLLIKIDKIYSCPYKHLLLDFRNIESLTHSAYMVIMAQVEKSVLKKEKTTKIIIDIKNDSVMKVISKHEDSQVHHRHLTFDNLKNDFKNKSKEYTPDITFAIEKDLKKINIYDFYELNTLITELLGNAVEHGIQNRDINWWLHHRYDSKSKSVKISFVDMGIGIAGSYRKAGLSIDYQKKEDLDIVKDSLLGLLGSSTKDIHRGKGLPQIFRMVENKWISDFILITNKACIRWLDNEFYYQKQDVNFVGTFYSFSINKNNFDKWKKELTSHKISA